MTTEIDNAAPGVAADTATPVDPANTTPEVAAPESNEAEQQPQGDSEHKDDPDKSLKRLQRRVDRVTAARYQAEAEARHLREELQRYQQQQTQPEEQEQRSFKPEDVERLAVEKARQLNTINQAAERSNRTFDDGIKAFGEQFKDAIASVVEEAGDLIDPRGLPTPLGEAILDSDKAHELLHFLGQNDDIAASLKGLSAARLGRKLAAIEADLGKAKVSKAPAPLQPITPKGAPVAKAESAMTDAEWYYARRKRN